MTVLALPALDGRTPLGWLAALGTLRLVTRHLPAGPRPSARLAWSPDNATALLVDAHDSVDALATDLLTVAAAIPIDGALPGLPPNLPPPGEAPDKLRLPRREFANHITGLLTTATDRDEAEAWLSSLATDLAIDDKGRAAITLWAAPSGKQSMRTMLDKPLDRVRKQPDVIREALVSWRRYPEVTGEYLDIRAQFDAADAADGKARMRGVPGATWLALMAFPLFRTTAAGSRQTTSGWAGRRAVWPLWSHPMDLAGARCLIHHPLVIDDSPTDRHRTNALATLSVFRMCAAERVRSPGSKSSGVLAPVELSTAAVRRRARRRS